jgi:uncharacterized membrane protein YqhA
MMRQMAIGASTNHLSAGLLVLVIFGLFGIFVIPFRFLTRSGRYNKRSKLQHRELLEAIRDGKMNKTAE